MPTMKQLEAHSDRVTKPMRESGRQLGRAIVEAGTSPHRPKTCTPDGATRTAVLLALSYAHGELRESCYEASEEMTRIINRIG